MEIHSWGEGRRCEGRMGRLEKGEWVGERWVPGGRKERGRGGTEGRGLKGAEGDRRGKCWEGAEGGRG